VREKERGRERRGERERERGERGRCEDKKVIKNSFKKFNAEAK